jgi:hypothetical protein
MDMELEKRLIRLERRLSADEQITKIEVFSVRVALVGLLILGLTAVFTYGLIELIKFIAHQIASLWL